MIHVIFQDIPQIVLSTYMTFSSTWMPFITPAPQSEGRLEGLSPLQLQVLQQSYKVFIIETVVFFLDNFSLPGK